MQAWNNEFPIQDNYDYNMNNVMIMWHMVDTCMHPCIHVGVLSYLINNESHDVM